MPHTTILPTLHLSLTQTLLPFILFLFTLSHTPLISPNPFLAHCLIPHLDSFDPEQSFARKSLEQYLVSCKELCPFFCSSEFTIFVLVLMELENCHFNFIFCFALFELFCVNHEFWICFFVLVKFLDQDG